MNCVRKAAGRSVPNKRLGTTISEVPLLYEGKHFAFRGFVLKIVFHAIFI